MFKERFLYEQIPNRPLCHAATVVQLPNGDLLAAFFAGQSEGAPDVAILTARLRHESEAWSDVRVTVDTPGKPYFNPVLFVNAHGTIRLFHMVLEGLLGHGGVMFAVKATDGGHTWSPAQPIRTIPGRWIRNKPIRLKSNRILLPCYYDKPFQWMGFCLYSDDEGETWARQKHLETGTDQYSYPTIIQSRNGNIHVLYTWQTTRIKHVTVSEDWIAGAD